MQLRSSTEGCLANFAVLAGLSRGLSGGDILNICLNAIHGGRADAGDAADAGTGIAKAKRAKMEHWGIGATMTRGIGFMA